MEQLLSLMKKPKRLAIGLMSGTCTDGIDAALVQMEGSYTSTNVQLVEFITIPYDPQLRTKLIQLSSGSFGGSYEISKMNFLLGKLFTDACLAVCEKAKILPTNIDFIASHGHTIYHQPLAEEYHQHTVTSTLQIGEPSVISERMHCPVISDFRVRDMAAGGLGAPLVPYAEYILYRSDEKNIALQNIGGIGNITYIPSNATLEDIMAFDTGPGNMIMDALISINTDQKQTFDENGAIASAGIINEDLLHWLLLDPYLFMAPPKTTGREYYGNEFVKKLMIKASTLNVSFPDLMATTTMFTAKAIEINVKKHLPKLPDLLIVGGGGSQNKTLMKYLSNTLANCKVLTNEDIGFDSNAKEAIAFAILGNETLFGNPNNVPLATGAKHAVVMGKITL